MRNLIFLYRQISRTNEGSLFRYPSSTFSKVLSLQVAFAITGRAKPNIIRIHTEANTLGDQGYVVSVVVVAALDEESDKERVVDNDEDDDGDCDEDGDEDSDEDGDGDGDEDNDRDCDEMGDEDGDGDSDRDSGGSSDATGSGSNVRLAMGIGVNDGCKIAAAQTPLLHEAKSQQTPLQST